MANDFQKLIDLSKKTKAICSTGDADFKITGVPTNFQIISTKNLYPVIGFFLTVLLLLPACFLILTSQKNIAYWLVGLVLIGTVLFFFRFIPISQSIQVNSIQKTIRIGRKNIFGGTISKPTLIRFQEFNNFSSEIKTTVLGKSAREVVFHRIYMLFKNDKRPLLDLPYDSQNQTLHSVFIDSLRNIIKKGCE